MNFLELVVTESLLILREEKTSNSHTCFIRDGDNCNEGEIVFSDPFEIKILNFQKLDKFNAIDSRTVAALIEDSYNESSLQIIKIDPEKRTSEMIFKFEISKENLIKTIPFFIKNSSQNFVILRDTLYEIDL